MLTIPVSSDLSLHRTPLFSSGLVPGDEHLSSPQNVPQTTERQAFLRSRPLEGEPSPPPAPHSNQGCGTGHRRCTGRRSSCRGAYHSPGTGRRAHPSLRTGARTLRRKMSEAGTCWRETHGRSSAAAGGNGTTGWLPARGCGRPPGDTRSCASAARRCSRIVLRRYS